jgi:hypothetical protein
MSWTTNIILHMGLATRGERFLPEVNAFLGPLDQRSAGFMLVDDPQLPSHWYGCTIVIGTFNSLDLDGLIGHLRTIDWPYPEDVQLIIRDEGETRFRIIRLFEELELENPVTAGQ